VLRYVGGDGQEGRPGQTLPCTLAVGVEDENGRPVPDVEVTFEVVEDYCGSLLDIQSGNQGNSVTVKTAHDGIAEVQWILGELEPGGCCRVVARLEDPPPQASALEVHFKATARREGEERVWPRVEEISWQNDQPLPLAEFNKGLNVQFTTLMDPKTADPDTFIVTLELPTLEPPFSETLYEREGHAWLESALKEGFVYPGHRIFIVPGSVKAEGEVWTFYPLSVLDDLDTPGIPLTMLELWLQRETDLFPGQEEARIRCRVVLKGNTILSTEGGEPLDGEAFGKMADDGSGATGLDLPSGDGHKGGDFESWFYLIK
jgi:hypothetical protein